MKDPICLVARPRKGLFQKKNRYLKATVGVRGGAPYFSGLGWSGADAKKRKVEK